MSDIPTFNINTLRRIVLRTIKEMQVKHAFIKNLLEYNVNRSSSIGKTFTYLLLFEKDLSKNVLLLVPYVNDTYFIRLGIFSLAIQGSFNWSKSKEGLNYWATISTKFEQIAKEFIKIINFSQKQPYKIIAKF